MNVFRCCVQAESLIDSAQAGLSLATRIVDIGNFTFAVVRKGRVIRPC